MNNDDIVGIPLENVDLGYCGKMETSFDVDYIPDDESMEDESQQKNNGTTYTGGANTSEHDPDEYEPSSPESPKKKVGRPGKGRGRGKPIIR